MCMDYWKLVKDSIRNGWEYKFLWLFGFLVVGADAFPGFVTNISNLGSSGNGYRREMLRDLDVYIEPAMIAIVVASALFLLLLFWILGVLSEGALIHGVVRKYKGEKVTFGDCWSVGTDKFWRLFGVLFILGVVAAMVSISVMIIVLPSFIASVALGVVLILFAIPVIMAIVFTVEAVSAWAIRFAVIDDEPWLECIGKGWRMLRDNFGKTFGVALSAVLSQFVMVIIFIIVAIIAAIPFVILGVITLGLGIALGILAAVAFLIVTNAFFGVYKSSLWTLAFLEIRRLGLAQAATGGPDTPQQGQLPDQGQLI